MTEEWLTQLRTGNFDAAVGKFESETLECKREPYRLDTEKDRFELVKDVSGLANASGGVLLIGFSTIREPAYSDDRIKEPRPFPLDRFDPTQYRQIISGWTWPKLDVDIEVVHSPTDANRCVAIITVAAATERQHPVLTAGIINESSGRRIDKIVGLFERTHALSGVPHPRRKSNAAPITGGRENFYTSTRGGARE